MRWVYCRNGHKGWVYHMIDEKIQEVMNGPEPSEK